MLIKLGEVEIQSEALGFPATVTPTEVQVGLRVANLLKERDEWRKKAEDSMARNAQLRENETKIKEIECDLYMDQAARQFKIDANDRAYLKAMWKKDPTTTRDYIDGLRSKAYLKEEMGLAGDELAPTNPNEEVLVKADELMKTDSSITKSAAILKVLNSNPNLAARRREEMISGSKGGDR